MTIMLKAQFCKYPHNDLGLNSITAATNTVVTADSTCADSRLIPIKSHWYAVPYAPARLCIYQAFQRNENPVP